MPIAARPATEEELLRFHTRGYIDRIRRLSEAGGGDAGDSARFGPDGFEVARLARVIDRAAAQRGKRA